MNQENKLRRLKANTNLTVYRLKEFNALPVMTGKGPFVREYLEKLYFTIQHALAVHPRLIAIRFDLRYPFNQSLPEDSFTSEVIQRFVGSLKAKIRHDRMRAEQFRKRVHDTKVRYVWVKEYGIDGRPHYHFLLLLNRDAYHTLGFFTSDRENLYSRIQAAWISALGVTWDQGVGLVHVPQNAIYHVTSHDTQENIAELFRRASYMCKVETKRFGGWEHAFGSSRI